MPLSGAFGPVTSPALSLPKEMVLALQEVTVEKMGLEGIYFFQFTKF